MEPEVTIMRVHLTKNVQRPEEGSKIYVMVFWPDEYDSVSMHNLNKVEVV